MRFSQWHPVYRRHRCRHLPRGGPEQYPSPLVDPILDALKFLRILDGMSLEEHYGFEVAHTLTIFKKPIFKLVHHKKFQLGLNNLLVFERL